MKTTSICTLLLGLAAAAGCGEAGDVPPPYVKVSGTVNYSGKPLEKGQITFALVGRPPVTMDIIGGKYTGQAMAGENRISVTARRKVNAGKNKITPEGELRAKQMAEAMGGRGVPQLNEEAGTEDYIPADWGKASKQVRVVTPGQENVFEFDIRGGK